jgi:hypothetical protein
MTPQRMGQDGVGGPKLGSPNGVSQCNGAHAALSDLLASYVRLRDEGITPTRQSIMGRLSFNAVFLNYEIETNLA